MTGALPASIGSLQSSSIADEPSAFAVRSRGGPGVAASAVVACTTDVQGPSPLAFLALTR